jgi:acetyl esterase/lipase
LLPAPTPRWQRDVVFGTIGPADAGDGATEPRQLHCDLWQPPPGTAPSGLAFVYFHGGGWHQYDKDSLTRPFFRHLAAQGHSVMDVAYRLYPETDLSGMVGDGKRAVAWIKANAARYGVDPERIVIAGGSAGGHLALLIAYTPGHPDLTPPDLEKADTAVRAVVALYPVVDLGAYMAYNDYATFKLGPLAFPSPRDVVPDLLGGMPDEVPERYELVSPLSHVGPACPPTLLLQAGHDHVVPVESVRALHRRLVEAGVPAVYVEFPGSEHAFDMALPRLSPAAQAAWTDIDRFLALI